MPAIDLLNLRLTQQHQQQHNTNDAGGLLNRVKNFFAPTRKLSTASLAPSHIASALKGHMNVLTGILPSTSSSCHVLNTNIISESKIMQKQPFTHSGNFINNTNIEIVEPELIKSRNRRKSIAFTISAHIEHVQDGEFEELEENESIKSHVNFILPSPHRISIVQQNSHSTLRERIKGSPRFPHRIVPTSSLNALEDSFKGIYNGN
jgi:gamma-aminobutyric acid type B receptor